MKKAKAENTCAGVRWAYMDFSSRQVVGQVKNTMELILGTYPELKDVEYGGWSDMVAKFYWPLVKDS